MQDTPDDAVLAQELLGAEMSDLLRDSATLGVGPVKPSQLELAMPPLVKEKVAKSVLLSSVLKVIVLPKLKLFKVSRALGV